MQAIRKQIDQPKKELVVVEVILRAVAVVFVIILDILDITLLLL
jgi:hypothetical protein